MKKGVLILLSVLLLNLVGGSVIYSFLNKEIDYVKLTNVIDVGTELNKIQRDVEIIGSVHLYLIEGNSNFLLTNFTYTGKEYKILARLNGENLIENEDYTIKIIRNGIEVNCIKNVGNYKIIFIRNGETIEKNIIVSRGQWGAVSPKIYLPSWEIQKYTGREINYSSVYGQIPEGTTITYKFYDNNIEMEEITQIGTYNVVAELVNDNYEGSLKLNGVVQIVFDPSDINSANLMACISCTLSFGAIIVLFVGSILICYKRKKQD